MKHFTCDICKLQLPAVFEGDVGKQTIKVIPSWTSEPILVYYLGEPAYPCPTCEKDDEDLDVVEIADWDNPNLRIHRRLRQHYARQHQMKLKEKFTPKEVSVIQSTMSVLFPFFLNLFPHDVGE